MAWTKASPEHIATEAAVKLYLRDEAFWTQSNPHTDPLHNKKAYINECLRFK